MNHDQMIAIQAETLAWIDATEALDLKLREVGMPERADFLRSQSGLITTALFAASAAEAIRALEDRIAQHPRMPRHGLAARLFRER